MVTELNYLCQLCEEVKIPSRPNHGRRQHYARGGPTGWEIVLYDPLTENQEKQLQRIWGMLGGIPDKDQLEVVIRYLSSIGAKTKWIRRATDEFGTLLGEGKKP